MASSGTRSAPEAVGAGGSSGVPACGGPRTAYLAPDVPELVELVDTAERALAVDHPAGRSPVITTDDLVGSGRWWGWLGLAAMGAAAFPVQPVCRPSPRERARREALAALRRLRRALAPALHPDPADARPAWWGPDHRRLVAFRVVVVDQNALDGLVVVAASEHPALRCLLAVLVPVDEADTAALAVAARGGGGAEIVLDHSTHLAYRRVVSRLLRALHQADGHGTTSGDRRTTW
jgi:hypothetical protein